MASDGGGLMKRKVLLKGPVLTRSGYGEQARFAMRALQSREDLFDIFIQPITWGATSWVSDNDEERQWIDQAIHKTIDHIQQGNSFDTSIQVTIPNEWEKLAPLNIGYTAGIETTKVAPLWLQKGNEAVDKIIVVSKHSSDSFKNTTAYATNNDTGEQVVYRLTNPIEYVGYPVKDYDPSFKIDLNLTSEFNFLCVAQLGIRKNVPKTIKWFMEEFQNEDVGLIVKTNMAKNSIMDREKVYEDFKKFINGYEDRKCKVYLLHGDMTEEEMHALYRHPKISALLALPHGEGFGLPIFEAAYSGLPVIATGWSGHLDFLVDQEGKEHFYNVAFDMQQIQKEVVWENVLIPESMWAFPREQSAKQKMRACYNDITTKKENSISSNACEYSNYLKDMFSKEKMYKKFVEALMIHQEHEVTDDEIEALFASLG
jgi:glycosyltransferase involved in cell wall biosynthesis